MKVYMILYYIEMEMGNVSNNHECVLYYIILRMETGNVSRQHPDQIAENSPKPPRGPQKIAKSCTWRQDEARP